MYLAMTDPKSGQSLQILDTKAEMHSDVEITW
jgi:hypothetical protein